MDKDYRSIRLLGEGAFGQVYLMRHVPTQRLVCVKALKECHENSIPWKEVKIMRKLCHPCIVRYQDSFSLANMVFIVMQYADKGDLSSKLDAARRSRPRMHFPESQIWQWFSQLCLALQYMHSRKLIHRDIKPPNLFLLGPEERLVLGDVGVAKKLDTTKAFAHTGIGTPFYMAPEIFGNRGHNTKADVWSLGVLLYELAYLTHAFGGASIDEIARNVLSGSFRQVAPEDTQRYSSAVGDLIMELLNVDPTRRPSVTEMLRGKNFLARRAQELSEQILIPGNPAMLGRNPNSDVSIEQQDALHEQIQTLWPEVPPGPSESACPLSSLLEPSTLSPLTPSRAPLASEPQQAPPKLTSQDDVRYVLEKLRHQRTSRLQASLNSGPGVNVPLLGRETEEEISGEEEKREEQEGGIRGREAKVSVDRGSEPEKGALHMNEVSSSALASNDIALSKAKSRSHPRKVRFSARKPRISSSISDRIFEGKGGKISSSSADKSAPRPASKDGRKLEEGNRRMGVHEADPPMTLEARVQESNAFLVRVLGEEKMVEARHRRRLSTDQRCRTMQKKDEESGVDVQELFDGNHAKYFPLFEHLRTMEATLSEFSASAATRAQQDTCAEIEQPQKEFDRY